MPLRRCFTLEGVRDDWEGDCRRYDLRARQDGVGEICSTLSSYLQRRYISKTRLRETLERRLDQHDIPIDLEQLLPSKPSSQNGSFGEALCLLCCREDGLLAPLDKLGGPGCPNPDIPPPGIDVLAFAIAEKPGERDEIYIIEVKTLSTTGGVRASVRGRKGVIHFFNAKVSVRPKLFHQEVNAIVRVLESTPTTEHLAARVLALGGMPLDDRRRCSHYCAMFLLDDRLQVERYLQELRKIDHPASRKWLRVLWFSSLRQVVKMTIEEAARKHASAGDC